MLTTFVIPIIALCAVATWTAYASFISTQQAKRHLQTLRSGLSCRGTVVGIQRPFLLDPCVRVYFEFVPAGEQRPLRCCHIERRDIAEVAAALPATGSQVLISYLPEQPEGAVIETLAARS